MDHDAHEALKAARREWERYGRPIKNKRPLPAWAGVGLGLLVALTALDLLRWCAS